MKEPAPPGSFRVCARFLASGWVRCGMADFHGAANHDSAAVLQAAVTAANSLNEIYWQRTEFVEAPDSLTRRWETYLIEVIDVITAAGRNASPPLIR
jgi:hypothetical protein